MGFIVFLTLQIANDLEPIIYKNQYFRTAKIKDTNLKLGEALGQEVDSFFQVEDKSNLPDVPPPLISNFVEWELGITAFDINQLKNFQYLEFEYELKPFFICFFKDPDDSYCFLRIFPHVSFGYSIEGKLYMTDCYEESFIINFHKKEF